VAGVAGAAADAQDEQAPAAVADFGQFLGAFFDGIRVEAGDDLLDFGEKIFGKTHSVSLK
jgi:hypothetical protein